ncbi:phosphoheptose isomerase [Nonomuraea fuscirosea]|uniref:phosphoheptose isomerase n=1 Tax=Nonomuraea fuscirosea TaxID=1291556 RepID=UPI0033DBE2EA
MSDLLDSDRLRPDRPGSDRPDSDRPGSDLLGSDLLGRARAERAAPGAALAQDAAEIVRAAQAMAGRFGRGGRLLAFGAPADAAHVAVEFTHPVIVGKRALPALAVDAVLLRTLGRPEDIALGIGPRLGGGTVLDGGDPEGGGRGPGGSALEVARGLGMSTVVLTGPSGGVAADHVLLARAEDPLIARELHVTTYHLLWELVHVFLEAS